MAWGAAPEPESRNIDAGTGRSKRPASGDDPADASAPIDPGALGGEIVAMGSVGARFVFDYVDPGSYLLHCLVEAPEQVRGGVGGVAGGDVTPHPFELRPPPEPVIDPADPRWVALCVAMEEAAGGLGVALERPTFVPWSRKAHELALQAQERGCFPEVHEALFRAHFVEGRDIGRVDTLVEIAGAHGMDRSETRAALDVDRQREALEAKRAEAFHWGVRGVPTLLLEDGSRLEGFRSPEEVGAFLKGPTRNAGTGTDET